MSWSHQIIDEEHLVPEARSSQQLIMGLVLPCASVLYSGLSLVQSLDHFSPIFFDCIPQSFWPKKNTSQVMALVKIVPILSTPKTEVEDLKDIVWVMAQSFLQRTHSNMVQTTHDPLVFLSKSHHFYTNLFLSSKPTKFAVVLQSTNQIISKIGIDWDRFDIMPWKHLGDFSNMTFQSPQWH